MFSASSGITPRCPDSKEGRVSLQWLKCRLIKYVVEDRVYNKELDLKIQKEPFFWRVIPKNVVYKFVKNPELVNLAKKLDAEGKSATSFGYEADLKGNFKRRWYLFLYSINQMKKFNKYCK